MKTCSNCKLPKPLTEFHLKRGKPQAQCKVCRAKYMAGHYQANLTREKAKRKAWYETNRVEISIEGKTERATNPEKTKQVNFRRNLRKYGITDEQYFQKLAEQNNVCALCEKPFTDTPHIDHCHMTGLFRGLLHDTCNTGFGLLREDVAVFERCIAYSIKYKK